MTSRKIVDLWLQLWEEGRYAELPITDDFTHTSPFGNIEGKEEYLTLVEKNSEKLLGHRFEIHDKLYAEDRSCVRYTAIQGDFELEVSEWHYFRDGLIKSVVAYYHIGEIKADRQLES